MYKFSLEELEALSRMPLMSAEEAMRQEERKVMRKEIERLEKRLAALIEKKHKMLFCAGMVDSNGKRLPMEEARADRVRARLLRSKAWKGNEYEIEMAKSNIKHLREELKGE